MILLQAVGSGNFGTIFFLVGMLFIFYFFMIRPQQKKQKQQSKFIEVLKKGDEVVTVGGMYGKVYAIENETVTLEIDKGVKIKFGKNSISYENTNAVNQKK